MIRNLQITLTTIVVMLFVKPNEAKLVPEYNLKNIQDFEVIKDEYKILYKEHFFALKEHIDKFVNENEVVLYETYDKLFKLLNETKIDTSGEFVSIKYKLLKQLADNRDDLVQVYLSIRYQIAKIAFKIIQYIEDNNVDKQTLYFLEYTLEQVLRTCKNVVPHSKHYKVLAVLKSLPYMFLNQNEISD